MLFTGGEFTISLIFSRKKDSVMQFTNISLGFIILIRIVFREKIILHSYNKLFKSEKYYRIILSFKSYKTKLLKYELVTEVFIYIYIFV